MDQIGDNRSLGQTGRGRARGRGWGQVGDRERDRGVMPRRLPVVKDKFSSSSSSEESASFSSSKSMRGSRAHLSDLSMPSTSEKSEESFDPKQFANKYGMEKKVSSNDVYLFQGFLNPKNISLSSVSDTIEPGEERFCKVITMTDTQSIYLIFSEHFSEDVDKYIGKMGRWYWKKIQQIEKSSLNVRDELLVIGAIVVVYQKEDAEWKRARIVDSFEIENERWCKVLFLDLGYFADVPSTDIVYLHESCRDKPMFAIKGRLYLSQFYNHERHLFNFDWKKKVSEEIFKRVQNKLVLVKFVERVEFKFENEKSWKISLLATKDHPEENLEENLTKRPSGYQPIEQQVIAKATGRNYVN